MLSAPSTRPWHAGQRSAESAYALPIILLLLAASTLVVLANLQIIRSSSQTLVASKQRLERHYEVESAIQQAAAWLRSNSLHFASVFEKDSLYEHFERSTVSKGSNDLSFASATKIKLPGTDYSVLLTNDSALGVSNFPVGTQANGSSFYPSIEFSKLDFGSIKVKITLLDALAQSPAKDYGAPPNPSPETDFYPLFRIDAMSSLSHGSHQYAYVTGNAEAFEHSGFYGEERVLVQQDCDSYNSSKGEYNSSSRNPSCVVQSHGEICVLNGTTIYGSVATAAGVSNTAACGGAICADFACQARGNLCEGANCTLPSLPHFDAWEQYCPPGSANADVQVDTGETYSLVATTKNASCWSNVQVAVGGVLQLTSTSQPYYIDALLSLGSIEVLPDDPLGSVTLYVRSIGNDIINGMQLINPNLRPTQLRINYLGTDRIRLNGNAEMRMHFVAPYSAVEVLGNADYFGSVMAKRLTINGNADLHLDVAPSPEGEHDIRYRLLHVSQYVH